MSANVEYARGRLIALHEFAAVMPDLSSALQEIVVLAYLDGRRDGAEAPVRVELDGEPIDEERIERCRAWRQKAIDMLVPLLVGLYQEAREIAGAADFPDEPDHEDEGDDT